jgi:hypothetical protein
MGFQWENLKERRHFKGLGLDVRLILKQILKKKYK